MTDHLSLQSLLALALTLTVFVGARTLSALTKEHPSSIQCLSR
jgi:hypothetical protein